jgi:hypothetical protein
MAQAVGSPDVRALISGHGAGLANVIYMQAGAAMAEFEEEDRATEDQLADVMEPMLVEDDNPYTYSKKEKWGDIGGNIVSEVGTYGGLGSMFGPLGMFLGAGIGGAAGSGMFSGLVV